MAIEYTDKLNGIFFAIGISIYGGVSDLWTALFAANLELSVIMSVVNTIMACSEYKIEAHFPKI